MMVKAKTGSKKPKKAATNGNGHAITSVELPKQLPLSEPLLGSLLEPHAARRISYDDGCNPEMLWAVGTAFGYTPQHDGRLDLDRDQTRGHHAYRVDPIPGGLVRVGEERRISLIVQARAVVGEDRSQAFLKVADYFLPVRGKLDEPPVRAVDRSIDPATFARVRQVLFGLPEDEVLSHNCDEWRFRETVCERLDLDAAVYPLASGSVVLFVRYDDLLWAVARQASAPYRRAEPPAMRTWTHGAIV